MCHNSPREKALSYEISPLFSRVVFCVLDCFAFSICYWRSIQTFYFLGWIYMGRIFYREISGMSFPEGI